MQLNALPARMCRMQLQRAVKLLACKQALALSSKIMIPTCWPCGSRLLAIRCCRPWFLHT